jgi:hypothetical protein
MFNRFSECVVLGVNLDKTEAIWLGLKEVKRVFNLSCGRVVYRVEKQKF